MAECCKTCRFFCTVRKHPTYQEALTHICVYFLVKDNVDYILETTEYDRCECYAEREEEDGGFLVNADGFCVDFHSNINGVDLEVIGNVHDNPELIGGENG